MVMIRSLIVGCVAISLSVQLAGGMPEGKEETLQGKLRIAEGKALLVAETGKQTSLISADADVAATLADTRLSDRPVSVLGSTRPDGAFSVRVLYVVRGESLYRVVYFCAKCNITTFAPGDCMCCQEPTVPIEVPPTDRRIYHETAPGNPQPSSEKPEDSKTRSVSSRAGSREGGA
jgi:hypothetical protein